MQDQKVVDFLEEHRSWKIRRVALVKAIHLWSKKDCSFRISNGPSRLIIMKCIFHNEKTPSMHMFINGNIHCYGCGTDMNWLELICELHQPYDVDDLLSVAREFVYCKYKTRGDQLLLDLS